MNGQDMDESEISLPGFEGMEGVEWVQKLPLFRTLTFEETTKLFHIAETRQCKKDDVIIEENALGEALYIVKKGRARVLREDRRLGHCDVGELFGEMSLIDDVLTSTRVEADADSELLVIPRKAFDELLAEDLALAVKVYRAFCRTLSDRLRKANIYVPDEGQLESGVH